MPGEIIDRPNPPPAPSNLPDSIEQLQVKLQKTTLEQPACDALIKFRRAAAYIAAGREERLWYKRQTWLTESIAMIFLQDNVLLKRDLKHEDIKPRLLGRFCFALWARLLLTLLKVIGVHARG